MDDLAVMSDPREAGPRIAVESELPDVAGQRGPAVVARRMTPQGKVQNALALGVAALIVVLSVMNGFENELRARLTSMTGHAWVGGRGGVEEWRALRDELLRFPGVTQAVPVVELEAVGLEKKMRWHKKKVRSS